MRTSKYLGKQFGDWTCTHVGIASVQGSRAKWAGHMNYYYIFERRTSDNKADKMLRLNAGEAAKVYRGEATVEEFLDKREGSKTNRFTRKVSWHFIDRIAKAKEESNKD